WLSVAGLNPLGAGIAAAKHLVSGAPLIDRVPGAGDAPIETTFVSNQLADRFMTKPLLGAMYLGSDWRHGQDLVWFLDISSLAASLALVMLLLALLLATQSRAWTVVLTIPISALLVALNPLAGLAVVFGLAGMYVLLMLWQRFRPIVDGHRSNQWFYVAAVV